MNLVDELLACPLFYSLWPGEVRKIASMSHFATCNRGEVVTSGRESGSLYILLSGRASVLVREGTKKLRFRTLNAFGVSYEKMFDTSFSRRCDLVAVSASEVMQIATDTLFALYHRAPKAYGILITNLLCQMFRDSGTANGLIAREFFAQTLRMRIPVYVSERRVLWDSDSRKTKIRNPPGA